ncbi:hypothetical protein BCD67_05775 [Oscillatoriales cyanobacterium USR001]|nr:hypothetical protein BCD67_05775 [Oscillatoriales cyanobacterium USR001]
MPNNLCDRYFLVVGAGFYNFWVGVKNVGEPAPTGLVKYEDKFVGGGLTDRFFHPQITFINPP